MANNSEIEIKIRKIAAACCKCQALNLYDSSCLNTLLLDLYCVMTETHGFDLLIKTLIVGFFRRIQKKSR